MPAKPKLDGDAVRRIALGLPETGEAVHFGDPSFHVRSKIFAVIYAKQGSAVVKLSPDQQQMLVEIEPGITAVKGYWGTRGWTEVDLAKVTRERLADTIEKAWGNVAPKKVLKAREAAGPKVAPQAVETKKPANAKAMTAACARARKLALALPEAIEAPHFHLASFRVGGKIFATMEEAVARMMVKLTPEQQHMIVEAEAGIFVPVPGSWGQKGATHVDLARVSPERLKHTLDIAWTNTAPKKLVADRNGRR